MSCFPSLSTLAKKARVSKSSVQRALKDLEEAGYVDIQSRAGADGNTTSNLYTILAAPKKRTVNTARGQTEHPPCSQGTPPVVSGTTELYPVLTRPNRTRKNTRRQAPPHTETETAAYHTILDFLEAENPPFDQDDYKREGAAIWRLLEKSAAKMPDAPLDFALAALDTLKRLKGSGKDFWAGMPIRASTLTSGGIWPLVLEQMMQAKRTENAAADLVGGLRL
jgi:DNA-binding transcriptional MocR family regulator